MRSYKLLRYLLHLTAKGRVCAKRLAQSRRALFGCRENLEGGETGGFRAMTPATPTVAIAASEIYRL